MITSHKMREGARDGGRDGRAESGGMAAKKLEPHTEMWGKTMMSINFRWIQVVVSPCGHHDLIDGIV